MFEDSIGTAYKVSTDLPGDTLLEPRRVPQLGLGPRVVVGGRLPRAVGGAARGPRRRRRRAAARARTAATTRAGHGYSSQ